MMECESASHMPKVSEARVVAEEIVAGTVGGCAGIIVGQPLDTAKVLLQTHGAKYSGPVSCLVETLRFGGVRSLFAGLAPPLLANAPLNAILFASYGNMLRETQQFCFKPKAKYSGPVSCLVETLRFGGVRSLFAGLAPPLLANAPLNAILFASYGNMLRVLDERAGSTAPESSLSHTYWAGAWAGFLQCLVVIPSDLVKCRMQSMQSAEFKDASINGPMACARDIYRSRGIPGFFVGSVSCMWRDVPSFGLYFLAYEYTKRRIRDWEQSKSPSNTSDSQNPSEASDASSSLPDPSVTAMLVAGAVAGVCGWGSTYPFDCIKSVTQTLPNGTLASERRMWVVAKGMYERGGTQAFTRGFGATIFRSVPVNAVTFLVYESILTSFQKSRESGV